MFGGLEDASWQELPDNALGNPSYDLILKDGRGLNELVELPDFQFGHLMIPLKGGQGVKPRYLRLAVKAFAELTRLQEEAEAANAEVADEMELDAETNADD